MKIKSGIVLFFTCLVSTCFSQENSGDTILVTTLPAEGISLDRGWKFHAGDNPGWAGPEIDDSAWENINPSQNIMNLPQVRKAGIGWFRLKLNIDSSVSSQPLLLLFSQLGAAEIYSNGRLIRRLGNVSINKNEVKGYHQLSQISFTLNKNKVQVLSVRYAFQQNLPYNNFNGQENICFTVELIHENSIECSPSIKILREIHFIEAIKSGLFFILAFIHLSFFIAYPLRKANLYFSATAFCFFADSIISSLIFGQFIPDLKTAIYTMLVANPFYTLAYFFLLRALFVVYNPKRKFLNLLMYVWLATTLFILFSNHEGGYTLSFLSTLVITLLAVYMTIAAVVRRQQGAKIIMTGMAYSFIAFLLFFMQERIPGLTSLADYKRITGHILFNTAALSIPLSISLYLAVEFASTSKSLANHLKEVQRLSALTLTQEKEKQQILSFQNENLERQVEVRTKELSHSLNNLKETQSQLIQREKMASLGELTAGIAHEIQNPLNFVNNFSEVNKELLVEMKDEIEKGNLHEVKTLADNAIENQEKISNHGKRADAIVKGMLQHSRTSSGDKEWTDINTLADEYLRLAYQGLRAKDPRDAAHKSFNVTMQTDFYNNIDKINIIPQNIGRVLLNLYNNAFYAAPLPPKEGLKDPNYKHEPTVWVSTKKSGDKVLISVRDNGPGIPQNIIDKIFQPFFTTKPTGSGTGLGLSLSYDIIKAHGGEIKVESKENEGTEFTILLPA